MIEALIKIVLSPNSMGILGNIPKGGQILPSKALNLVTYGTRVWEPSCFQYEDILHQEDQSYIIH
jgi:hypothetical protein